MMLGTDTPASSHNVGPGVAWEMCVLFSDQKTERARTKKNVAVNSVTVVGEYIIFKIMLRARPTDVDVGDQLVDDCARLDARSCSCCREGGERANSLSASLALTSGKEWHSNVSFVREHFFV